MRCQHGNLNYDSYIQEYLEKSNVCKKMIRPDTFLTTKPIVNTKWDIAFNWSYPSLQCDLCKKIGIDPILSFGEEKF